MRISSLIILLGLGALVFLSACKAKKNQQANQEQVTDIEPTETTDSPDVVIIEDTTSDDTTPYIEDIKKDPASLFLSYERTACFGTCPVFKITWNEDGTCTYHGINFVDDIGFYVGQMPEGRKQDIMMLLKQINYTDLDETYDALVSDLPATITEVHLPTGVKRVYNRYQGPIELKSLYTLLDEIIDEVEWTPKNEQKQ